MPRGGGFRESIVASDGHYLLASGYKNIELRGLASICERRYGHSRLGKIIRDGIDPHGFTAASFAGLSLDEFEQLKQQDPGRAGHMRQKAKILNFGLPAGLSAPAIVSQALNDYGIEMSY